MDSKKIDKEIESIDPFSMDLEKMNKEKLKTVFPECFVEDKLDIDKLLALCGEYIIEDFEKYKFEWKGKSECLQLAQKRSMGTLRPCPEESVDFENTKNIYIEGDNLEVLKLLQVAYFRKVKMIYIDPPYNTGHDFVYEDDYSDPIERYKAATSQATKSNPETMGRFHTKWLNMMYPRLKLASYLLRDDGVIFISIDDSEVHNLRKLCDEVFGEENFIGTILWKKKTNGNNMGFIPPVHDYIIVYAKSIVNILDIGYNITEEFINKKYSNPDNDIRGSWTTMDLSANHKGPYFSITNPNTGEVFYPPEGRYWVFNEDEVKKRISNGRIIFGKSGTTRPVQKVFASERLNGKIRAESWWDKYGMNEDATLEIREMFGSGKLFTHPKPSKLIYNLIKISTESQNNDIILDFFSGSATTAHAAMQLNAEDGGNRQFIMVQLPELCDEKSEAYKTGYKNICEIGKERIRRAGKKILDENNQLKLNERETPLDVGFKVFKLDTSNLNEWNSITKRINEESDIELFQRKLDQMLNKIKPDRSDLDVVYEVVLKLGFPLSTWIGTKEIAGKKCFIVSEECLILICLEQGLTFHDIQEMAEYKPANLVFSKQSFADSNTLLNAHYKIRDIGIEIKLI